MSTYIYYTVLYTYKYIIYTAPKIKRLKLDYICISTKNYIAYLPTYMKKKLFMIYHRIHSKDGHSI